MKKGLLLLVSIWLSSFCLHAQLETTRVTIKDGISDYSVKAAIERHASALLSACNEAVISGGKLSLGKDVITPEALKALQELWKTSAMACPLSEVEEIGLKTPNGYQIRNIPVSMLAAEENEKNQELVISFTPTGKIDDILLAIEQHRYKEILEEHETVEDFARRQVIIDFVENYRTAYNRKDLKYIETVFSDNALIITGKIIREKPKSDFALRSLSQERVVFQKQTKKEYIENLKRVFAGNRYINVQFDEFEVMQHPKHTDIYGVTVHQKWNSDRYSDKGFVFLMIDFQDELNPLIQVRTWQPDTVNNIALARDEVFSLGDFDIVRSLIND